MAGKISLDEQVKFLVSCIGHSTNGRPDFEAVANELGIVSKAAAQKRFERLLKACGVAKPGSKVGGDSPTKKGDGGDSEPKTPSPNKRKAGSTPGPGSVKKRSGKKAVKSENQDDSEEEKKKIKPEADEEDTDRLVDSDAD